MDSPKFNLKKVAQFIRRIAANHHNRRTGDYDTQTLADEAARHFALYDRGQTPEEFVDVAFDVTIELDRRH